jgi:NAD(P)H-dependent flavin oxidoreductase YrpB (nitropropane dioxygenase family)
MNFALSDLNLTNPVLAAPMAGGASTPAYVTAAARAGSLGFQPEALPLRVLIAAVRDGTGLPVIAAGGLSTPAEVAAVMHAGADAAMVGTVLLRCDESGASAVHKAAIADPTRGDTVVTRAFTGRPARALPKWSWSWRGAPAGVRTRRRGLVLAWPERSWFAGIVRPILTGARARPPRRPG